MPTKVELYLRNRKDTRMQAAKESADDPCVDRSRTRGFEPDVSTGSASHNNS